MVTTAQSCGVDSDLRKEKVMQYRQFGKLDWKVSALGFGAMRLPVINNDQANVDEPEAIRMIRYAIDHGVNYLDTAYPYHAGNSERIVGRALKDGYREKMRLATKLPARMVESTDDFDRFFNEQLERLDTNKIDFYLLHGLNRRTWPKVRDLGVLRWAEGKIAAGRFDYLGYSFHDDFDVFKEIVDAYDWTFCQVQYNYMDIEIQAGRKGVEYAANKGMAVVVMEPLRGGKLGKQPEPVMKVWDSVSQKRSPAEWALLWVLDQPEISVALSGMSTMEQVVENVKVASRSATGLLTEEELALYDRVRDAYQGLTPIPCTGCEYCMPCPNGVDIPRNFQIYNDAVMYEDMRVGRFYYRGGRIEEEHRAEQCTECSECVDACPQEIDIPEWLKKVHEELGPKSS